MLSSNTPLNIFKPIAINCLLPPINTSYLYLVSQAEKTSASTMFILNYVNLYTAVSSSLLYCHYYSLSKTSVKTSNILKGLNQEPLLSI